MIRRVDLRVLFCLKRVLEGYIFFYLFDFYFELCYLWYSYRDVN